MMRLIAFVVASVAFISACTAEAPQPQAISNALEASVLVSTPTGAGSGVAFKNGGYTFVWTDAHVVDECQTTSTVIDGKTGLPKVLIGYKDVHIVQDLFENHRKVGEVAILAKIIRFGAYHDLALLHPYKANWPTKGVSFDFNPGKVGDGIYHVGSFNGSPGSNSFSECNIAAIGRLRSNFKHNEFSHPIVFDQLSGVAHHGSSGGGVFKSDSGKCLGLVTEFVKVESDGALCYAPARRMLEFARRNKCEWAINPAIPVDPNEVKLQLTDGYLALPKDWPKTDKEKEEEKSFGPTPIPINPNKPNFWEFIGNLLTPIPELPPPPEE